MAIEAIQRGEALCVRLARPSTNALDLGMIEDLTGILLMAGDTPPAGGLVLTGAGAAFSSGIDATAYQALSTSGRHTLARAMTKLTAALLSVPVPVVAAINGDAIGGGMVLALGCDYRIGLDDEQVTMGLYAEPAGVPFAAGPATLVKRELPPALLRRMALTGSHASVLDLLGTVIDEVTVARDIELRCLAMASAMAARTGFRGIKEQMRGALAAQVRAMAQAQDDPYIDLFT